MPDKPTKQPLIHIHMPEDLLRQIDDYRFENRIDSRAEAIRELIERGLEFKRK